MRVLFDANVVLDVLLARQPHFGPSASCMALVSSDQVSGLVCATTVTTIYYLARKLLGPQTALDAVARLLGLFEVAAVDGRCLNSAAMAGFADFEDAVQHESARHGGADCIVTRNAADFAASSLPVYTPEQLIEIAGVTS